MLKALFGGLRRLRLTGIAANLLAVFYKFVRTVHFNYRMVFFSALLTAALYVSADDVPLNFIFFIPVLTYLILYLFGLHLDDKTNHLYLVMPAVLTVFIFFLLSPYLDVANYLFGVIREWFGHAVRLFLAFREAFREEESRFGLTL